MSQETRTTPSPDASDTQPVGPDPMLPGEPGEPVEPGSAVAGRKGLSWAGNGPNRFSPKWGFPRSKPTRRRIGPGTTAQCGPAGRVRNEKGRRRRRPFQEPKGRRVSAGRQPACRRAPGCRDR